MTPAAFWILMTIAVVVLVGSVYMDRRYTRQKTTSARTRADEDTLVPIFYRNVGIKYPHLTVREHRGIGRAGGSKIDLNIGDTLFVETDKFTVVGPKRSNQYGRLSHSSKLVLEELAYDNAGDIIGEFRQTLMLLPDHKMEVNRRNILVYSGSRIQIITRLVYARAEGNYKLANSHMPAQ